MTKEKWLDLKEKIHSKFEVIENKQGTIEDVPDSHTETVVFSGPLGKVKIEWHSKPKTLGEDTLYSNRVGGRVEVKKIYSDTERSEFIKVFLDKNGEWEEISAGDFQL